MPQAALHTWGCGGRSETTSGSDRAAVVVESGFFEEIIVSARVAGDDTVINVQRGFRKVADEVDVVGDEDQGALCLLYTSPSPRDRTRSRMPSSA